MKKGFDANKDLTRFATSLANNGYDFVGRYYNINNPSKNLSLAEAHILSTAGLKIVAIWENGFPTSSHYFSYQAGVHDGTSAYYYASQQIHQPALTPIYFAVDYDAAPNEIDNLIVKYFQGIQDGFNTISGNNSIYSIGVYGSGLVCSSLLSSSMVTFTWLAQSMGWRGSRTFNSYNIKQSLSITECIDLGGISGDPNECPDANEGSFSISVV